MFVIKIYVFFRSPSSIYMQNYLELMDKLLAVEIPTEAKSKAKERDDKEDKVLCAVEGDYTI